MTVPDIVDAHMHVGEPEYPPIEQRIRLMDAAGVARAILVGYMASRDNEALHDAVGRYPARFVALGRVDETDPDAPELVQRALADGRLCGLRVRATARSPGEDRWAIWQVLDEAGAIVSVRATLDELIDPEFGEIVRRHPRIRFRFEHVGGVRPAEEPPPYARFRRFLELAEEGNTTILLSGFHANSDDDYPYLASRPFIGMALEAFGPQRMMWSGDTDRAALSPESYRREWSLIRDDLGLPPDDAAAVLGQTAAALVGWDTASGISRTSRSSS